MNSDGSSTKLSNVADNGGSSPTHQDATGHEQSREATEDSAHAAVLQSQRERDRADPTFAPAFHGQPRSHSTSAFAHDEKSASGSVPSPSSRSSVDRHGNRTGSVVTGSALSGARQNPNRSIVPSQHLQQQQQQHTYPLPAPADANSAFVLPQAKRAFTQSQQQQQQQQDFLHRNPALDRVWNSSDSGGGSDIGDSRYDRQSSPSDSDVPASDPHNPASEQDQMIQQAALQAILKQQQQQRFQISSVATLASTPSALSASSGTPAPSSPQTYKRSLSKSKSKSPVRRHPRQEEKRRSSTGNSGNNDNDNSTSTSATDQSQVPGMVSAAMAPASREAFKQMLIEDFMHKHARQASTRSSFRSVNATLPLSPTESSRGRSAARRGSRSRLRNPFGRKSLSSSSSAGSHANQMDWQLNSSEFFVGTQDSRAFMSTDQDHSGDDDDDDNDGEFDGPFASKRSGNGSDYAGGDDGEDDDGDDNDREQELNSDPHDLIDRFVIPQKEMFQEALDEVNRGRKESCWFWFVIPTAPYIVDGVERGSSTNRKYCLRTDDAVHAYLSDEVRKGVNLRRNYITMLEAVLRQLKAGNTLRELFGPLDDVKAMSSFRLFERIAKDRHDEKLVKLCRKLINRGTKEEEQRKNRGRQGTDRRRSQRRHGYQDGSGGMGAYFIW